MNKSDRDQKHFKVVYGKVLGMPVGSATPITQQGHRIFGKYFAIEFLLICIGLLGVRVIENPGMQILVFLTSWIGIVFVGFLFYRQLKKNGEFERIYFFKKTN